MSVKKMLASLGTAAEATAAANHGKAKVVESEGFSPFSSAGSKNKDEETKAKSKKSKKSKAKAKAKDDEEES